MPVKTAIRFLSSIMHRDRMGLSTLECSETVQTCIYTHSKHKVVHKGAVQMQTDVKVKRKKSFLSLLTSHALLHCPVSGLMSCSWTAKATHC